MGRYVALLRGINVGGKNLIKMADLKACFEEHDFAGVATYIQSGNVLFESDESSAPRLAQRIEGMLAARFDYRASVVLRSRQQLRSIVKQAPEGFGTQQDRVDAHLPEHDHPQLEHHDEPPADDGGSGEPVRGDDGGRGALPVTSPPSSR